MNTATTPQVYRGTECILQQDRRIPDSHGLVGCAVRITLGNRNLDSNVAIYKGSLASFWREGEEAGIWQKIKS